MTLLEQLKTGSHEIFDEVKNIRRHLHAHPELSKLEKETSAYICRQLDAYGISYKTFEKHYGILAQIEGLNPSSKVVALRADMDALPINEKNDVSYKSQNKGVMHACGHDAHTAILLGTAKLLNRFKTNFSGTIKLIFQPSEECYPGGAIMMIEDGVLNNPEVDVVIGQHVIPTIDSGKIGIKKGMSMASTDEIYITVKGKGGHAATPDLNTDPIAIGAQIITALQQIVSRKAPPHIPTVISFGRFIADGKVNIIPDEVNIEGTIRTFNENWRAEAHRHIEKITTDIASAFGATALVNIEKGYPFLVNDAALTERCTMAAQEMLGIENVEQMDIRMTAEDFAYFSQMKPSCFFRLGIKNTAIGITSNLHTATFDIDEEALITGIEAMAWMALKELDVV